MILRTIDFQLQIDNSSKLGLIDYCYGLSLKIKHICNYIERTCLKQLKFKAEGYSGIVITFLHGYPEEKMIDIDQPYVTFTKLACIDIRLDKQRYDNLKTDNEFREFIYEYMVYALKKIETKYAIPTSEMLAAYNELKENDFKNEWLYKKKTDRKRKLLAELHCTVTIDKFTLTLKVTKDSVEVYNQIILETLPDEYKYAYLFNGLKIEEDKIIITTGKKIFKELTFQELGIE